MYRTNVARIVPLPLQNTPLFPIVYLVQPGQFTYAHTHTHTRLHVHLYLSLDMNPTLASHLPGPALVSSHDYTSICTPASSEPPSVSHLPGPALVSSHVCKHTHTHTILFDLFA